MNTTKTKRVSNGFHLFWNKYLAYMLGIILLLTFVIRFVEPVQDGDLFWHMKYGEYMLENRTLVPDHSIYSWTPAGNEEVYCTWVGDILLYYIHLLGGLPLLFIFRYLCMFSVIAIVWIYGWRFNQGKDPFTFLVMIVVLISSSWAAIPKPEIFSLVFFSIAFGLYFFVKATQWTRLRTNLFLLYPLLFLIWVNTHGVFFFGLIWLAAITFGEILNYLFRSGGRLSAEGMRHLLAGALLSPLATFLTPYGYKLHLQLWDLLFGKHVSQLRKVISYKTIFSNEFSSTYLVECWVIMLLSFGVLFIFLMWKKRECDWAILISTIFLACIYAKFSRSAYYWSAFWGMSIIYLRARVALHFPDILRAKVAFNTGVILLFLFLAARTSYSVGFKPIPTLWFGFGIGYMNPVQASAFLKEHRPGKLLYNSYNSGGYLLYDLYPDYKVFIDPRYFPYKKWFAEYREFHLGPTPLEKFQEKYPIDVAVMEYYSSRKAIKKFMISGTWDPVFYGPDGIVFVKKSTGFDFDFRKLDKHRFDSLHSLHQASKVYMVSLDLDDLETSEYILQLIKKRFSRMPLYEKTVERFSNYQEGLTAMHEKDYEVALEKLNAVGVRDFTIRTNQALVYLWKNKAEQYTRNKEYRKALDLLENILRYFPNNVDALYNAGIVSYVIDSQERLSVREESGNKKTENWKKYLEHFLELAPNHLQASIARQMLKGKGFSQ